MVKYASADQLKAQTKSLLPGEEPLVDVYLEAAADAINSYCNRPDGFIAETVASVRRFTGLGQPYLLIDENVEVTAVSMLRSITDTTYTPLAGTDWFAFSGSPEQPDFNTKPYSWLALSVNGDYTYFTDGWYGGRNGFRPDPDSRASWRYAPTVEVTAKWGYSVAAPPRVQQASIIMASRWLQRGRSGWADTIQLANQGSLMYIKVLDPDVQLLLDDGRLVMPAV